MLTLYIERPNDTIDDQPVLGPIIIKNVRAVRLLYEELRADTQQQEDQLIAFWNVEVAAWGLPVDQSGNWYSDITIADS